MKQPQRISDITKQIIPGTTSATTRADAGNNIMSETERTQNNILLSHLWLRLNPINVLTVDITETKRHINNCQFDYNENIKEELLKEFPGTDKEAVKKRQKEFKKRSFKTEYVDTAIDIICMFNGHLLSLRKHKLPFKEFTTNNVVLGRKMRDATKRSGKPANKATAYRHVRQLMTVPFINGKPFITEKPFHGSHHDYGMVLNEEALVASENNTYNLAILQSLNVANNMQELHVEIVSKTWELRPSFSGFFSHQWLQLANHSIARTLLENNNLDKAVFVNNSEFAFANSKLTKNGELPIAPAIGKEQPELEHRGKVLASAGNTPPVAPAPPAHSAAQESTSLNEYRDNLERYTKSAMGVMMATLYPGYMLWTEENKIVISYLHTFFGNFDHHRDKNSMKIFADRLGEFTRRIILTQSFILKYPNRYVPSPGKWLNPLNPHGFAGTKAWLNEWKKGDKKTLVELMLKYQKTPDTSTFTNGMKLLSRKRDKRLAAMFSGFVVNQKETYSHEKFAEINPQTAQN
jgi:hypothetical protein